MKAAVSHLVGATLQAVRDELLATPAHVDHVARAVGVLYRASTRPEFAAEMEIWAVSRVDPDLVRVLGEAERPAHVELLEIVAECFGPTASAHPRFPVVAELTVHFLRGLTVSGSLQGSDARLLVLDHWTSIARTLLDAGHLNPPHSGTRSAISSSNKTVNLPTAQES